MGTIIGIIIGIVALFFLYGILCALLYQYPILTWILSIGGGLTIGFASSSLVWGALSGFLLLGFCTIAEKKGESL